MNSKNKAKLWGGRFTEPTDAFVEEFTQSVSYDQRLAHYDIMGSIAHVRMLVKAEIITPKEGEQIISSLEQLEGDISAGQFEWSTAFEDVHMNIEAALVKRVGEVGKKLHTGRSRNDQVATGMRLYLRDEIDIICNTINDVIRALLKQATEHTDTIMPGFTHLQVAQPITLGHHLLAWIEMLLRDKARFQDCRKRVNVLPLGSAALAGTSYPIDREYVAKLLDFDSVSENSLDAVSDRDFIIEFTAAASVLMMHLSRFSEELILWMSAGYRFIELGDAWCTGSSIMPQKKNPDIPELIRGKTGQVYGNLMAILTIMKAQPLAYNRDNQEDKIGLFHSVDMVKSCLLAYVGLITTLRVNKQLMYQAALKDYSIATDLADYLVANGLAFRDAHEAVGKIVQYAITQNKTLTELQLSELHQFCSLIKEDVFAVLSLESSVAARNHIGGTAPDQVKQALIRIEKRLGT